MVQGRVAGSGPSGPGPGQQTGGSRGRVDGHAPTGSCAGRSPGVDGALTTQPRTPTVPPARSASASSMQSPPASAEATSVSICPQCSPVPALRRGQGDGRRVPAGPGAGARVAGRSRPALATRRWSSKRMRIRSGVFCGSIYWVLLVSGLVSVPKPLSQIQRSTRWLLQGLSPRTSFGGFGLS